MAGVVRVPTEIEVEPLAHDESAAVRPALFAVLREQRFDHPVYHVRLGAVDERPLAEPNRRRLDLRPDERPVVLVSLHEVENRVRVPVDSLLIGFERDEHRLRNRHVQPLETGPVAVEATALVGEIGDV